MMHGGRRGLPSTATRVIRFRNHEVDEDVRLVVETIRKAH